MAYKVLSVNVLCVLCNCVYYIDNTDSDSGLSSVDPVLCLLLVFETEHGQVTWTRATQNRFQKMNNDIQVKRFWICVNAIVKYIKNHRLQSFGLWPGTQNNIQMVINTTNGPWCGAPMQHILDVM